MSAGLQALQHEAYTAVCRAFYAQEALRWEQEDVLTKLREFWNISNQMHSQITTEMRSDVDVVAVRSGGYPSRLGARAKPLGGAAPAPSIGYGTMGPPPARQRAAAVAAVDRGWQVDSDDEGSLPQSGSVSDGEGTPRKGRAHKRKAAGAPDKAPRSHKRAAPAGGGAMPGSLAQQASFRRQQSRPGQPGSGALTPGGYGGGGAGLARVGSGLPHRSRSTRQNSFGGGGADPMGYCGRRLWRFWPAETPPWVEGFIQQWDPDTDGYTIVYDPNTRESTEEVFHFSTAIEGQDFVVGEYVDMTAVHGSRRQGDKPYVSPEALAAPPPPGLLAALAPAPSKKRKSMSGVPVPQDAPFEVTYLHARLPIATEDELQDMLTVLERKERIVQAEVDILEYQEANREDVEARAELERKFAVLCEREASLMAEIAALREATVV